MKENSKQNSIYKNSEVKVLTKFKKIGMMNKSFIGIKV